jgi:NAD(P)-dependent dehydrogenase (short-subunit alcohol dehydrogenase family)
VHAGVPAFDDRAQSGCIINISSILAEEVIPPMVSYSVSKIALEKLTQYAGLELSRTASCELPAYRDEHRDGRLDVPQPGDGLQRLGEARAASEATL